MRQRNHCSSLKGIPKMKLQDSGPSGPKSLQSQNRPRPENRLSISRLDVVHGQLWNKRRSDLMSPSIISAACEFRPSKIAGSKSVDKTDQGFGWSHVIR